MHKHFHLLDADLSKYKLGRRWGDGRYEEEIECEGIYLYNAIRGSQVVAVRLRQNYNLFSASKYEMYWVHSLSGRHLRAEDFIIFDNSEKVKRVNICISHRQDTLLKHLSIKLGKSKSKLIRYAIDEFIREETQVRETVQPYNNVA